jgi:hypothetical protein
MLQNVSFQPSLPIEAVPFVDDNRRLLRFLYQSGRYTVETVDGLGEGWCLAGKYRAVVLRSERRFGLGPWSLICSEIPPPSHSGRRYRSRSARHHDLRVRKLKGDIRFQFDESCGRVCIASQQGISVVDFA